MQRFIVTLFLFALAFASTPADDEIIPSEPKRGESLWGADDQRGAANRITPEKVVEATQLIKAGKIYSLGREYEEAMPVVTGRSFTMLIPQAGPPMGKNKITGHDEFIATQIGQVGTQLDGMGHIGINGVFYNGHKREDFAAASGLKKLGIQNAGVFFTRGLLLDIAGLKGKERMTKGEVISDKDLKDALKKQNLEIRPGDAVFLHTGWGGLWKKDNELYNSGCPGIYVPAAKFLIEKKIVLVGADTWGMDAVPGPDPEIMYPAHQWLIPKNGIYILENLDTAALAKEKVYEFAFILSPIRLVGATGSPGNPIAVK